MPSDCEIIHRLPEFSGVRQLQLAHDIFDSELARVGMLAHLVNLLLQSVLIIAHLLDLANQSLVFLVVRFGLCF